MAHLLGGETLHLAYPTQVVFESVTVGVNDGDRIGIVGRNGEGKSSLLGLLTGRITPNSGRVTYRSGLQVAALEQADTLDPTHTVAYVLVGDRPEHEWAGDAKVRDVVAGLVADLDWQAPIAALSGGPRRRGGYCEESMSIRTVVPGGLLLALGAVFFGGTGSQRMLDIARELDDTPLVLLCGRNSELAAQLRRAAARAPIRDDTPVTTLTPGLLSTFGCVELVCGAGDRSLRDASAAARAQGIRCVISSRISVAGAMLGAMRATIDQHALLLGPARLAMILRAGGFSREAAAYWTGVETDEVDPASDHFRAIADALIECGHRLLQQGSAFSPAHLSAICASALGWPRFRSDLFSRL